MSKSQEEEEGKLFCFSQVQHDISVEEGSSQTKSQVTKKTRSTSPTNNSSYKSIPSSSYKSIPSTLTDVDSIIQLTTLCSEDHKEQMLDMKKQKLNQKVQKEERKKKAEEIVQKNSKSTE